MYVIELGDPHLDTITTTYDTVIMAWGYLQFDIKTVD